MLVRTFSLLAVALWLGCSVALAAYNYISAADLEARLQAGTPTHIVDIQVEADYASHHIRGAQPTYAYPVQSDSDRAKLAAVVDALKADQEPIVIVCPRGGGGATRTYDYLLAQGIAAERLLILEKGQAGWNCLPLTEGK